MRVLAFQNIGEVGVNSVATSAESESVEGPLCGVVVTYFPAEDVERRLMAIAKQVDVLVVIDNSASEAVTSRLEPIVARMSAHLISNCDNLGVATALNQGVAFARTRDAARVAFFDQDSEPVDEFRSEMDSVRSNYNRAAPLGILGCNYIQADRLKAHFPADRMGFVSVDHVITSGSMYDVAMLTKLGRFKDEFFIDGIDIEYCWRALANGYCVCRTKRPLMFHVLGNPVQHTFLGRNLGTSNHPAFRRYFMARNAVLILREYFLRLPRPALHLLNIHLKGLVLLSAFEAHRAKKLGFVFLGLWHGLQRRMDMKPWHLAK